ASAEIGWGELTILKQPNSGVLAHRVTGPLGSMIALHNFTPDTTTIPLAIEGANGDTRLVDLLHEESTMVNKDGTVELDLDGYGYRWLRVLDPGSRRLS